MAHDIWATIGIDRTDDRRAIRSAYAERLRAIDVDADPDGFAELREAYEIALAHAQAATTTIEPIEIATIDEIAIDEAPDESELLNVGVQIFHEIAALLAEDEETYLSDGDAVLLDAKMHALLAFLEQAPIDEQQQAEFGIAHILASAFPRSDFLLEMAAEHFGWLQNANALDMPDSVRAIVQRIEMSRLFVSLHDEKHPLHKAFIALTAEQKQPFWRRPPRKQVHELLALAYGRYPGLLHSFEPQRLGEWEYKTNVHGTRPRAWPSIGIAAFVILNGLRLVFSMLEDTRHSDPSLPISQHQEQQLDGRYQDATADIAAAIDAIFSGRIKADELSRGHPDIYAVLVDEWDAARKGNQPEYHLNSQIALRLTDIFETLVRDSDRATLIRYWTIRLRMAQRLPDQCDTIFIAGRNPAFYPELISDYQTLMADVIRTSPRQPVTVDERGGKGRFNVPQIIVERAEAISGMGHAAFVTAMGAASDPAHCKVKSAIIKALTNTNSSASTKLMRQL